MKATVWLKNSIVLIVLGPYHGPIQLTLWATMRTVLILQVPFFICRYLLLNIQVPFSTRQQTIHGTVLSTPDLLMPHTAFPCLPATVPVFWNVSTHFFYLCAHSVVVHAMPPQSTKIEHLSRDAPAILRERYLAGTFSVTTQWYCRSKGVSRWPQYKSNMVSHWPQCKSMGVSRWPQCKSMEQTRNKMGLTSTNVFTWLCTWYLETTKWLKNWKILSDIAIWLVS